MTMESTVSRDRHLLPQGGLVLRPVGPFDSDLLALMHAAGFKQSWDRPWSRQSFAEILAMPGNSGLIAATAGPAGTAGAGNKVGAGEEPVGFGITLAAGDEVELLLLTVLPLWRRRGIAQRLLLGLLYQAWRGGVGRALLEVAATNAPAIACYEKVGFNTCGRRKDYYAPGIDALIYERFLTAGNIQAKNGE